MIRVNATYSTVIDYRETAPAGTRIEDYNADPDKLIEGMGVVIRLSFI